MISAPVAKVQDMVDCISQIVLESLSYSSLLTLEPGSAR